MRAAVSPAKRVIAEESDAPAAAFDTRVKCSEAVAATTEMRMRNNDFMGLAWGWCYFFGEEIAFSRAALSAGPAGSETGREGV